VFKKLIGGYTAAKIVRRYEEIFHSVMFGSARLTARAAYRKREFQFFVRGHQPVYNCAFATSAWCGKHYQLHE
jgi:hypothetical protein